MANEGKRTSSRKLDTHAMNQLTNYRKEMGCSLHPKRGNKRCNSCPYKDDCMRYELERAYIHDREEINRDGILNGAREDAHTQYEEGTVDDLPFDEEEVTEDMVTEEISSDEEGSTIVMNEEDRQYPCGVIQYTCESKECLEGKECPYAPKLS